MRRQVSAVSLLPSSTWNIQIHASRHISENSRKTEWKSSGGSRIFLGASTPKVGVLTYYFAIFFPKPHENETIWVLRGGRPWRLPWIRQWSHSQFHQIIWIKLSILITIDLTLTMLFTKPKDLVLTAWTVFRGSSAIPLIHGLWTFLYSVGIIPEWPGSLRPAVWWIALLT